MKLFPSIALSAALLLGLVPAAGCGSRPFHGNDLPAEEAVLPLPETEELPALPETGEVPTLPETGEVPPEEVPAAPEKAACAQYICVLADGLNVRTGAGTEYPSLGTAERGVLLGCTALKGGWYQTQYCGKTAYVSANERYTEVKELQTGDEITEKIISAGLRVLGTPYVYGAVRLHDGNGRYDRNFSDAEFDCSSLMQYMFDLGGNIPLGVTTRTQVLQGEHVAREEIRRGDLLFFTNASRCNKTGIERVGHVALYLGENYILHTASDFAKIEQISAKRWGYFLEARRVR